MVRGTRSSTRQFEEPGQRFCRKGRQEPLHLQISRLRFLLGLGAGEHLHQLPSTRSIERPRLHIVLCSDLERAVPQGCRHGVRQRPRANPRGRPEAAQAVRTGQRDACQCAQTPDRVP